MIKNLTLLDPDEPGLDEETRFRRQVLKEMATWSTDEHCALAVRAGIYTEDGELTPPYRHDAEPSICRPTN